MPNPHNIKFCHVLRLIWELRSLAINIPYPVTRPCHHLALPLLWNMELWNSTLTATPSPSLPYTFTPPIFSLNKALDFSFPSNHPSPLGFKDTPTIRPSPHLPLTCWPSQPADPPSWIQPSSASSGPWAFQGRITQRIVGQSGADTDFEFQTSPGWAEILWSFLVNSL